MKHAETAKKMSDDNLREQIKRIDEALPELGDVDSISYSDAGLYITYSSIRKACTDELKLRKKQ